MVLRTSRFVLAILMALLVTSSWAQKESRNSISPGGDIQAFLAYEFVGGTSLKDAIPGGRLRMRVYVTSAQKDEYQLTAARSDPANSEVHFNATTELLRRNAPTDDGFESTYSVTLTILEDAKPRYYWVELVFKTLAGKLVTARFDLPFGAKDSSYIEVIRPKDQVGVTAGERAWVTLEISNKLPQYKVFIYDYRIECSGGLVVERPRDEKKDKGASPIQEIPALGKRTVRIPLDGATWPAITNLKAQPKANITLYYSDGIRDMEEILPSVDLDFRLGFHPLICFLCALVGGLVGVWLRSFLPDGNEPLTGRRRPRAVSKYAAGILMAAIGWCLSLGLQIEVLAFGGRALASHATPFGSLVLGIGFGILHPTKVALFIQGIFSKAIAPPKDPQGSQP